VFFAAPKANMSQQRTPGTSADAPRLSVFRLLRPKNRTAHAASTARRRVRRRRVDLAQGVGSTLNVATATPVLRDQFGYGAGRSASSICAANQSSARVVATCAVRSRRTTTGSGAVGQQVIRMFFGATCRFSEPRKIIRTACQATLENIVARMTRDADAT
jgi:hypothetical protein